MRHIELGYGSRRLSIETDSDTTIVRPPKSAPPPPLRSVLEYALDAPIESPPLRELAKGSRSILMILSDATRDEPRAEMLEAVRSRLPFAPRLAIANGTHTPVALGPLALPEWADTALNHDSRNPINIVELATTSRGTPLRLNRALIEADLIVATGSIRPHYFAGFGGGVKAIFPGLGENSAIRLNHQLKAERGARPGNLDNNPCRLDLEEVLDHLDAKTFLLNTIVDASGAVQGAVGGHVVHAHREGARRCRRLWTVRAPQSASIVVSDRGSCGRSLYQACKMIAAVATIAQGGAQIVVAAECADGLGGEPAVINEAIYELGIRPRLPASHRIVVVAPRLVSASASLFCEVVGSLDRPLPPGSVVFPEASGGLLVELEE